MKALISQLLDNMVAAKYIIFVGAAAMAAAAQPQHTKAIKLTLSKRGPTGSAKAVQSPAANPWTCFAQGVLSALGCSVPGGDDHAHAHATLPQQISGISTPSMSLTELNAHLDDLQQQILGIGSSREGEIKGQNEVKLQSRFAQPGPHAIVPLTVPSGVAWPITATGTEVAAPTAAPHSDSALVPEPAGAGRHTDIAHSSTGASASRWLSALAESPAARHEGPEPDRFNINAFAENASIRAADDADADKLSGASRPSVLAASGTDDAVLHQKRQALKDDMAEVRTSGTSVAGRKKLFKKLQAKYHPDRHYGRGQEQLIAAELFKFVGSKQAWFTQELPLLASQVAD